MRYKILIAVMAELPSFKNCISKCPDKEKLIIVNNFTHEGVGDECEKLQKQGAEVHWHPENRGVSFAMNVGLHTLERGENDFVVILSPSALFNNTVNDLVEAVEAREKQGSNYYYLTVADENWQVPGTKTDLHAFAVTRRMVDEIGIYDENFYPVYFEDTDLCWRMGVMGVQKTIVPEVRRVSQTLCGAAGSDKRILRHYELNAERMARYYIRKWGAIYGQEVYRTPYNDPNLTVKDWTLDKSTLIPMPARV